MISTLKVSAPRRIGRRDNGIRMTPEEFDAIDDYDELYSYELLNGVLLVLPFQVMRRKMPMRSSAVSCETFAISILTCRCSMQRCLDSTSGSLAAGGSSTG